MARIAFMSSQRLTTLVLGGLALLLVVSIILFPDQAFQSSLQGLTLWWKLVFPALLPFLIITEIVRGMGILHGLGALFDPLLRTLFRLPGISGWAIALGFTAGAPSGAVAVSKLRRDRLISREEAERLLSMSHVLSPVFLVTIVGVGFLHHAQTGLALAIIHYGTALLLGLWQRMTQPRVPAQPDVVVNRRSAESVFNGQNLLTRGMTALKNAQAEDGRTFGKLLGDSVVHAVQQLMVIGGLMMMFSVLIHVVSLSQVIPFAAHVLSAFGLSDSADARALLSALLPGLFEMHLGAFTLGQHTALSGTWQYALLSALFAWGGLSTHAQVKSFTYATDIRYSSFLRARLIHAALSFAATAAFWQPLNRIVSETAPTLQWTAMLADSSRSPGEWNLQILNLWLMVSPAMLWLGSILLLMLVLSVFTAFAFRHPDRTRH
ncbi:nucleoside recognition domain-containing protein [Paenibacillus rigui]|uniref:Sporulation protein n=1 Tax=Paenibacillus rigui TaxID=554312 RepID=A0A229UMG4_9BACL|nr:nucleoside recognition domain-containing protein [Paenibacillus rigui]OXM84626.1 sporulation protein [Paenibacillus rigui]